MEMKLPRLLGMDLVEKSRLHPSRITATIQLTTQSTASMTLPDSDETVNVREFVEIFSPEGTLGIFRVSSVRTTYGSQQQISLEHGLVTLEDSLTPESTVINGSLQTILSQILSYQTKTWWALGDVDSPESETFNFQVKNDNLLQAALDAVAAFPGHMMTFDQSVFPWVMHVRKMADVSECECRLNRNLSSVNVSLDDSELCTRVLVKDGDNMTIYDGDTIDQWGVISRVVSVPSNYSAATYARRYLQEHENPKISISIDAMELSSITGEPLDRFRAGALCRVAMPHWRVTLDERIVTIAYSDLLANPEKVKLTLSNARKDVSSRLATIQQDSAAIEGAAAAVQQQGGQITTLTTDVSQIYDEIDGVKGDIGGLKTSVATQGETLTSNVLPRLAELEKTIISEITSGDLNSYRKAGTFTINAESLSNCPVADHVTGFLHVISDIDGQNCVQTLFSTPVYTEAQAIWVRTGYTKPDVAFAFGEWMEV